MKLHTNLKVSRRLKKLLRLAKRVKMTPAEREAQRISFAFGNLKIEDASVTRSSIERAAARMRGER